MYFEERVPAIYNWKTKSRKTLIGTRKKSTEAGTIVQILRNPGKVMQENLSLKNQDEQYLQFFDTMIQITQKNQNTDIILKTATQKNCVIHWSTFMRNTN